MCVKGEGGKGGGVERKEKGEVLIVHVRSQLASYQGPAHKEPGYEARSQPGTCPSSQNPLLCSEAHFGVKGLRNHMEMVWNQARLKTGIGIRWV